MAVRLEQELKAERALPEQGLVQVPVLEQEQALEPEQAPLPERALVSVLPLALAQESIPNPELPHQRNHTSGHAQPQALLVRAVQQELSTLLKPQRERKAQPGRLLVLPVLAFF